MASIYQRPDSQKYQLTCYPRPGAKLLRASLDTKNELEAKKVAHAVELLIELEKLGEIQIPKKLMAELPGVRSLLGGGLGSVANSESRDEIPKQLETPKCAIDDAIR